MRPPLDPKVRAQIRRNVKNRLANATKYAPQFDPLMEWVFAHGPIEASKVDPRCLKHPEFDNMLEPFDLNGVKFFDLSGEGRYYMTGDHDLIEEKPWRPK